MGKRLNRGASKSSRWGPSRGDHNTLSFSLSGRASAGGHLENERNKDAWRSLPRLKFKTKEAQKSHNVLESHYG